MPFSEPATLKSHIAIEIFDPGDVVQNHEIAFIIRDQPIAMPEIGRFMGTPASISARVLPQVLPIEVLHWSPGIQRPIEGCRGILPGWE